MIPKKAILLKSGAEFICRPDCAGMYVEIHYIADNGNIMIEVPFPNEYRTYCPIVFQEHIHIIDKCNE